MDGLNGLSNWVHCEDPAMMMMMRKCFVLYNKGSPSAESFCFLPLFLLSKIPYNTINKMISLQLFCLHLKVR